MSERLVDCALTERARKKLRHSGNKRRDVKKDEEVTATQDAPERLPHPSERGVVYLGHIPHGFYEEEMRSYFAQFGTVTRLKLYRSRKVSCSENELGVSWFHESVSRCFHHLSPELVRQEANDPSFPPFLPPSLSPSPLLFFTHTPTQTGRSRGYAFIEFEFPEVAAIVAESMNNYLMFDKLLKCESTVTVSL